MTRRRLLPAILLGLLALVFVGLGLWQVQRRAWKHALIAAVETRSTAAPVAPPVTADPVRDPYRRIRATGRYLPGRHALVQAVTERGPGYWVVAPLDTGRFVLMVNRGFIPQEARGQAFAEPTGRVGVTGLLRLTEPGGGFLRSNDPAADRWYSRDVAAIAKARGLPDPLLWFLDADASGNAPGQPVGGLTVLRFSDNHLSYALTWFGMAGLCLFGLWRLKAVRDDREEPGPS